MFTVSYTKEQVLTLLYSLMQRFPTTVLQNIFTGSTRNNGSIRIKIFKYHKELQLSLESWGNKLQYLGTFTKLQKSDYSFVVSVRPSAWNNLAPTRQIFMKFDISVFFFKSVQKIKVSIKPDKNNGSTAHEE
jgi:hypothetical protein